MFSGTDYYNKVVFLTVLSAILLAPVGAVNAAPTGLILIPTADVSPAGSVSLGTGIDLPADSEEDYQFNIESAVGVAGGLEFGYDAPAEEMHEGALFVKKCVGGIGKMSTALGVNGIGEDALNPYVVCSSDTAPTRIHIGVDYLEDRIRPFAGIEYLLTNTLGFVADWVSGSEGTSSCGLNMSFGSDNSWALMGGLVFTNGGGESQGYLNLSRSFTF